MRLGLLVRDSMRNEKDSLDSFELREHAMPANTERYMVVQWHFSPTFSTSPHGFLRPEQSESLECGRCTMLPCSVDIYNMQAYLGAVLKSVCGKGCNLIFVASWVESGTLGDWAKKSVKTWFDNKTLPF